MEEKQKLLDGLFRKWGSPSDEGEIRIIDYLYRAEAINETDRIVYYDNSAKETIERLENAIKTLKAYRETLQERYNYLTTAPFQYVVKLKREKRYQNKVIYFLEIRKRYTDTGKEVVENCTKYIGTERHKAIKAYKEYVKSHPGIIAEIDIEKSKWER